MVCVGEGEETLIDLCDRIQKGNSWDDVTNLWIKNKDFSKIIIITGNIGCGKNTLAHIILKDYTIITINDYEVNFI